MTGAPEIGSAHVDGAEAKYGVHGELVFTNPYKVLVLFVGAWAILNPA